MPGKVHGSLQFCFFRVTQAILVLTALGKLVEVNQWKIGHRIHDPLVSFLTANQALLLAASLEIAVAVYITIGRSYIHKVLAILWLCVIFCLYRIGLDAIGIEGYCKCLGHWKALLGLSEARVDIVAKLSLGFMFCGSLALLVQCFSGWRKLRSKECVKT